MIIKLLSSLIGIVVARIMMELAYINILNWIVFEKLEPTFDFSLVNYYPQAWLVINILTGAIALSVLMGMFSKSTKKKLDSDKKNFTHLSSIHEAKRTLTRLQFKRDGKRWVLKTRSLLLMFDEMFNPIKKIYNAILTFLRVDDWHKLNTIKTWNIDKKNTHVRSGLPIYMPRFRHKTMFIDGSDNHTLIIGTTNSGKSFSEILQLIETIRMAGECAIINDPKGELYEYTAKQFEEDGYELHKLNFINPEASDSWAPLELAWNEWKKAYSKYTEELKVWEKDEGGMDPANKYEWLSKRPEPDYSLAIEYIMDLAETLTYDSNVKDPFWNDSAKDLIVGMACFLMEENIKNGDFSNDVINFKAIRLGINYGDTELTKEQRKALNVQSDNVLGALLEKSRKPEDASYMNLMDYCRAPIQTRQSIKKVFATKINLLTMNEQIMRMTSKTSFNLKDLGNRKMVIYLIVHDEKKIFYPLVTVFLKQLYETIINQARGNKGRLSIPLNLVLDEFGNFPPLKDIKSQLTAARSRGVRYILSVQDLSQLVDAYGKDVAGTIQNNCSNTVYILGSQTDTLKNFSTMCGNRQVWIPSRKWYESRPLISVDRLQKLNMGEVVIHRQRKSPFIARMIPYDKCCFYRGKRSDPNISMPPKPRARWLDLKELLSAYGNVF